MGTRALAAVLFATIVGAAAEPDDSLNNLSLEQLTAMEVVTVGKKPQRLDHSAAAVSVITQEDIHRSGATSIPEALRLAPGVMVSRVSGNFWTVSIRGFNNVFSNKLQVLLDGRSVYSLIYGGVFWDMHETLMEDIDRIEVIRGPVAALWGTNAVNGVINVITKRAEATQGSLVSVTTGDEDALISRYRYGGQLGRRTSFRVYGVEAVRSMTLAGGTDSAPDEWSTVKGGFRVDSEISDRTTATVQGELFRMFGSTQEFLGWDPGVPHSEKLGTDGGNILARWTHLDRLGGETTIQSYYDRTTRNASVVGFTLGVFDVDAQYRRNLFHRHDFQLGVNARWVSDRTWANENLVRLVPPSALSANQGLSALDEITVLPDKLLVTAGVRADHNWTGNWSTQPTARVLWTPDGSNSFWASVSRSARVLDRIDAALDSPAGIVDVGPVQLPLFLVGNPNVRPESSVAWEAGYRTRPLKRLALDIAGFRSSYRDVIDFQGFGRDIGNLDISKVMTPRGLEFQAENFWKGVSHGVETSATASLSDRWRVSGWVSAMRVRLQQPDGISGINTSDPLYQWHVRNQFDFTRRWQTDVMVYSSGLRKSTPFTQLATFSSGDVPARTRVDMRVARRIGEWGEFSFGIRNALTPRALEYRTILGPVSTEIRRNVFVNFLWRL